MSSSPQRTWTNSGVKPHVHPLDHPCRLILSVTTGKWGQIKVLGQAHLPPVHQTPHKVPVQNPHQTCPSNRYAQGAGPGKGEVNAAATWLRQPSAVQRRGQRQGAHPGERTKKSTARRHPPAANTVGNAQTL